MALAACGSPAELSSSDMAGMGETMSMGDASATPASAISGADLRSGRFVLLESAPSGYERLDGTADIARHDRGTTVTISLSGLPADTEFISHVHTGSCEEAGGPHFMFDTDGPPMPPNEIHLAFTTDAGGAGFMTAENERTVPDAARSIVVHPLRSTTAKVACAEVLAP